MDMKKSTVEVVVQAEQLRKEAGSDKMYVEYVFYGLLKVASYLEDPRKGTEYRKEAEELRLFLEEKMRSISSARMKLREDALKGSEGFDDAAVPVGRAAEIAGGSQFSPLDLAKAILEAPSTVIREACKVKTAAGAAEDARYDPGATMVDVGSLSSAADDRDRQQQEEEERRRKEEEERKRREEEKKRREERERKRREEEERKQKEEEEKRRREEAERKRKAEEERKRKEEEERKQHENGGMTVEQLRQLLEGLPTPNANNRRKPQKPNRRRQRTKIGLITFRGGKIPAVLQYIALALILPFAVAAAVELLTGRGVVTNPPTEWAAFGVRMFILLWAFWVFRGICNLVGIWSRSFCLYLRTLGDVALIAWVTVSVKGCFHMTEYPDWIRYVSGLLSVLIICVAGVLYDAIHYTDAEKRRSIKSVTTSGPVPKVMFQKLTRLAIFPCVLLLSLWIQTHAQGNPGSMFAGLFGNPIEPMKDWQIKGIWIIQFIFAWNVPYYILTCLNLAVRSNWYYGGGKGIVKFLATFYMLMFIPCMVLFLHWLFAWNPMQLWVMIVLGVYTLFSLIMGIVAAKN